MEQQEHYADAAESPNQPTPEESNTFAKREQPTITSRWTTAVSSIEHKHQPHEYHDFAERSDTTLWRYLPNTRATGDASTPKSFSHKHHAQHD
jgi:hypothetical protein